MHNNIKYAYTTLLSSVDYLDAVIILKQSLINNGCQYEFVCVVTQDIVDKVSYALNKYGINYQVIDALQYCKDISSEITSSSLLNTASKINLLGTALSEYEKCVYIDADCLVLQNIDSVFEYKPKSIIWCEEDGCGFSGLFVFSPEEEKNWYLFNKFVCENTISTDGKLIGITWNYCKDNPQYRIPKEYCSQSHDNLKDVKVIHFSGNQKPWKSLVYNDSESYRLYYKYMMNVFGQEFNNDR